MGGVDAVAAGAAAVPGGAGNGCAGASPWLPQLSLKLEGNGQDLITPCVPKSRRLALYKGKRAPRCGIYQGYAKSFSFR